MSKKKILELNKLYYPQVGGIERIVQQISEGLADDMVMTALVCSTDKSATDEIINGVRVIRIPTMGKIGSLPIPIGYLRKLHELCKTQDVIHLHMPFPIGDLACLLSGYKGKIVLWWHSDVVRQKKAMILYKPIMLRMLKRADKIVVATEGHINGSAFLGPFRKKCIIIPFGVDRYIEAYADRYMEQKESDEGVNQGKPVRFLFVGRLVYYKGCDILISAFAKVKNAELVMVGTGTMEPQLKKMAEDLGVDDRTYFQGEVSDEELCQQFEACDVFVLPSVARSEAFGIVQIEAMAFGKPVINTNLPSGVPYVGIQEVTGLTVPPGDVAALANAMNRLVEDASLRNHMGTEARKRMKEKYRMDGMLENVKNFYQSL